MANPSVNDEELQLKQRARRRLIGAVTLVTGLVVFLPMVLDNEPKPVAEDIAINIPSQDAKGGTSVPLKIGVPEIAAPEIVAPKSAMAISEQTVPPAKTEPPAIKPAAPKEPAPKTAQPPQPEPVKAASPKPEKAAAPPKETKSAPSAEKPKPTVKARESKPAEAAVAPAEGGFVVRLGAFSKPENAKQLKAKVAALGVRNYTDVLKSASGDKILVRAGPYATRHEAEMARDRLKAGNVVGDVVPK